MNGLLNWQTPAVKKLLGWRQSDEEEKWAEKAIDTLVKKIKKRPSGTGTLEDLEFALANPGSISKCVTIPKSLDGRLQISHKKGLPHFIYCKVWRWPDLQSHQELRPIPECMFPHDNNSKTQHVCINPYHYQRIEHSRLGFQSSPSPPFSSPEPIPSPNGSFISTNSPPPPSISSASSVSSDYCTGSPSVFSEDGDAPTIQYAPLKEHEIRRFPQPQLPCFWASVNYYELNTRVGEPFKVQKRAITVDGFTDPSNSDDRICLGLLTNVNRNIVIENTRKHIGRGVRLLYDGENNLEVHNLSDVPVFMQSRNCNVLLNQQHSAVCRLPPGSSIRAFDFNVFYNLLQRARALGTKQLYDLQHSCIIRLSFVKGWGPEYPRQDVTCTPCWIEIQLHIPLAWIDQSMNGACKNHSYEPTSVS